MGSKLGEELKDDKLKDDKKRAKKTKIMPELLAKPYLGEQAPAVDTSSRSIRRIVPIGDFKKTTDTPDINAVVRDAQEMVSAGVNPDATVSIMLPNERGQRGPAEKMPIRQVAQLASGNKMYERLKGKGGWIDFGGEGGGEDDALKRRAINLNMKLAGIIAARGLEEKDPAERRNHAIAASRFIAAAEDVHSGAVPPARLYAAVGGSRGLRGLGAPNLPPRWYMIGEASKVGFIWMLDQLKYRFQYTMMGKFFTVPWSSKSFYSEQRKKMKKLRKLSDLEKRLDIFDVNVEDVFDLGKLSIEEVWELDKIEKVKPTMDEYYAMSKLMQSEGYYEYAEAASAFKMGIR